MKSFDFYSNFEKSIKQKTIKHKKTSKKLRVFISISSRIWELLRFESNLINLKEDQQKNKTRDPSIYIILLSL